MADKINPYQSHQFAFGYNVLQPIVPFQQHAVVKEVDDDENIGTGNDNYIEPEQVNLENNGFVVPQNQFVCPVILTSVSTGAVWQCPVDPLVSVSGKNNIVRRYVAKSRNHGSVKELWSRDDFEVTITGVLLNLPDNEELKNIRAICESEEAVGIICQYLNDTYNINYLAIESFEFPFTKGEGNYQFTIKGYSDEDYPILTEPKQ